MAVLFQPFQSQIKDKSGKFLYHPRIVRVNTVSTEQVAKEVASYSSLTTGDVKSAIDNLVTVITQHLHASENVTLDGLGTFRMVMRSAGNGVENSEDVSASQATVTVNFRPASKRNIDGSVATRSLVTGVKFVRFDKQEAAAGGSDANSGSTDNGKGEDPTA